MNAPDTRNEILGAASGAPIRHESAHLHVSGEATYVDDIPELRGTLHAAYGLSREAHARIVSMDLGPVRAAPGVVAVFTAADIPGENNCGPVIHDEPILATGEVHYVGQPMFLVVARSTGAARRAARLAKVTYEKLPAILDIREALAAQSYVLPPKTLECGDPDTALARAPRRLKGEIRVGGQEQFYLEGQIAYAVPLEDGAIRVHSSTQHPTEIQQHIARALAVGAKDVMVECRRMGGGFGGKETQGSVFACGAALAAHRLRRPVKLRADRDDDMTITGKRHDFLIEYDVGFDDEGRIAGIDLMLASRCGWSADLSSSINDRAMAHSDNCYYLENARIRSFRCRTNMQSATAFRGFGGPQGMMGIEWVVDEIARSLGRDPLDVRKLNFYGVGERDWAPYGMRIEDNVLHELVPELEASSDYRKRREAIRSWNETSPWVKRGIALTPLKFGISFTNTMLNQGGALVNVYTDGTVLVNHGGTEMGQGLYTKVAQVVADEFGVPFAQVRVNATDVHKVPNTSATAASSGTDLNARAAQIAARAVRERIAGFLAARHGVPADALRFEQGRVRGMGADGKAVDLSFAEAAKAAWMGRVSLSSTGYHRTPKIEYDDKTMKGRSFYYFAYGAAVSEVAVDTLTGEMRLLRADVLHDVGRSLNPAIDLGQVEGGFVQGMGWLTTEELHWNADGRLTTHAPSTYKIPVSSDVPADFRVKLWERGINVEDNIFRSKAVGEPPLMLAISVFHAVKDAVAASAGYRAAPLLNSPATAQEILFSIEELQKREELRHRTAAG